MSVDINELRINSHVLICGKRRKVLGLGCGRVAYLESDVSSVSKDVPMICVDPIPITEELLKELGFERKIAKHKDNSPYYFLEFDEDEDGWGNTVFVEKHSGRDLWRVEICDKTMNCGNIRIQWLHELENFYYHVFKKELIEG